LAALWDEMKVGIKVEFDNKDEKAYWVASVMEIKGIKGIFYIDHEREDLYLFPDSGFLF
jgi:sensor domain CHASE-containing protein